MLNYVYLSILESRSGSKLGVTKGVDVSAVQLAKADLHLKVMVTELFVVQVPTVARALTVVEDFVD